MSGLAKEHENVCLQDLTLACVSQQAVAVVVHECGHKNLLELLFMIDWNKDFASYSKRAEAARVVSRASFNTLKRAEKP